MLRFIVCPFVSYMMAVPLTSLISLDLRQTEWTNVLTYVWWAGSWMIWGFIALVIATAFAKYVD